MCYDYFILVKKHSILREKKKGPKLDHRKDSLYVKNRSVSSSMYPKTKNNEISRGSSCHTDRVNSHVNSQEHIPLFSRGCECDHM